MVQCPICGKTVAQSLINEHIDSGCENHLDSGGAPSTQSQAKTPSQKNGAGFSSFFQKASASKSFEGAPVVKDEPQSTPLRAATQQATEPTTSTASKRPLQDDDEQPPSPLQKKQKQDAVTQAQPLAERMRPRSLDDIYGQSIVAPGGILRSLIETNRVPSIIFWGGPGTGKTTIARLIAAHSAARFVEINSTSSGVGECKRLFNEARNELSLTGRRTIVFCDEIHRFSKSQQDVFLAPVEAGTITLIGATTENPSFKVINALMSRCRVFTLTPLTPADTEQILTSTLAKLHPPDAEPPHALLPSIIPYISTASAGDARTALNLLSLSLSLLETDPTTPLPRLKSALTTSLLHDRQGDSHYNLISALHKSIRGSAPDAALYYLARMLTAGEDPLYVARRLVVIASEDVGLADNSLLGLATAAHAAAHTLGMPEARIPLAHCTVALALAPKSVRAYRAYTAAEACVREPGAQAAAVPMHLRNAPTRLLREMGAGAAYKYNPEFVDGRVRQGYMPEGLEERVFLEERDLGTVVDEDLEGERADGSGQGGDVDGDGGEAEAAPSALKQDLAQEKTPEEQIELEEWEA